VEITPDQRVFLLGHRGAISPQLDDVILLELTVALTSEDTLAAKGEAFIVVIPADEADKMVTSIQTALQRLRRKTDRN
jgi:hypothetical protein